MQERQETWVPPLVQENPLKKEMATHFIFCAAGRVTVTVNFMCNLTQPQDTWVLVTEYQADEQAGVARLSWRVSGR